MKNDHLAFSENENIVKQPNLALTDVADRKISSKSDLDTTNLPKYDSDLINSLPDQISDLYPIYWFEQKNSVLLFQQPIKYSLTYFKCLM